MPDVRRVPLLLGLRIVRRIAHRNQVERNDIGGKPQHAPHGLYPFAAGINPSPYGSQPQGMGRKEQVFRGRRVYSYLVLFPE